MQAWDVITYGGGEGLFYTFNAVAAFFNGKVPGNSVGSLAATLGTISAIFASAIAVFTMVIKQDLKISFNWLFGSYIIMNALMLPKINVLIIDRVTGFQQPVANVPFMLGAFAGATSQLGDAMAKKMDDIFTGPIDAHQGVSGKEVMSYRTHGVAMASQLVSKASRFTITDADMAANMREFVQQCVIIDIAKGKYTINSILETNDLWGLLKENASPARGFPYRHIENGRISTNILTCQEGAEKLDLAWGKAIEKSKKIYGQRFFPQSKNPAHTLVSNMSISYEYLTNISAEASDILRQNMMLNALEDGLLSANQINNASAAVTGYATTRAQEQQKTAYSLQGSMASLSLSVLKIVVEVMFYAIFPLIVIIAIMPGGVAVLKKYVIALFWIQSWAPLYSVLNMLVNIYGRSKSMAAIAGTSAYGISAATMPGLVEGNEWVAAVAGYTMMSVPFLSYGLIHYGAGAFSQLSTHFGSVTQSAASHAAEEATTGNYSMGNTNFDNHSRHNISGFKQDQNLSVATGRSSVQMGDGSWISKTMDGKTIVDWSGALSKMGGSINLSGSMSQSLSESAESSHRQGVQEMTSAQESITAGLQLAESFNKTRSNGVTSDNSQTIGDSYSESKSLAKYLAKEHQFAQDNNISDADARAVLTRVAITGRVSGGIGADVFGINIGGSAGLEGSAGVDTSGTHTKSELEAKALKFNESENLNELRQNIRTEAENSSFRNSSTENKAYSDALSASFSRAENHTRNASASFSQEQQYRESAQRVSSNSAGYNVDASQQYLEFLINKTDVGKQGNIAGARQVLSNPELNQKYMSEFIQEKAQNVHKDLWSGNQVSLNNVKENYQANAKSIYNEKGLKQSYQDYTAGLIKSKNQANLNSPVVNVTHEDLQNNKNSLNSDFDLRKKDIKGEKDLLEKKFDKRKEYT